MTLNEFIELYDKSQEYEIEVVDYIPYVDKVSLCKSIIDNTTNVDIDNFDIDSSYRNVLYKLSLIDLYTNIDVDFDNIFNQYDLLERRILTQEIIDFIPQEELFRFDMIMECLLNDLHTRLTIRRNR